ncbi:hypothetical protein ACOWKN_05470, partial [Helicobacter pylori]
IRKGIWSFCKKSGYRAAVNVDIGMLIGTQLKLSGVSSAFKKYPILCKESFCIFAYPFGYRAYSIRIIKALVKKGKRLSCQFLLCFLQLENMAKH